MTPLLLSIAAFACLGCSLLLVGLLLRQPGWQLRDSPLHAVVCVALGAEAALVLASGRPPRPPG